MDYIDVEREARGAYIEAEEACAGYTALDPLRQEIGVVEELFTNGDGEPKYLRVKIGLLGRRSLLIPVGRIILNRERRTLTLA